MKVNTNVVVKYEGIGFTAQAVAQYPAKDWVAYNKDRYFAKTPEAEKVKMLEEIHGLCVEECRAKKLTYPKKSYTNKAVVKKNDKQ